MAEDTPADLIWHGRRLPGPAPAVRHPRHRAWMPAHTHAHPTRELVLALAGDHRYGVDGRILRLRPGDGLLLDAGEPHDAGYPPFAPPCRDLWLVLAPPHFVFANEVRAGGGRPHEVIPRQPLGAAHAECLAAAWDACRGPEDAAGARRLQAAATMCALAALATPPDSGPPESRQRRSVEQIRRHLAANLGEDLSLKHLARLVGYAPEHFHRIFRRYAGLTLHEHVNRLRLERARQLLAAGTPAAAVAGQLGFATAAYFSRFFRRAIGQTPSAWAAAARR